MYIVFSKMLSILKSILPVDNNIRPSREQRRALINELWKRDDPQIMIVRYNDEDERLGTQGTITAFHTNPIEAIYAFFHLLGDSEYQRHPALNDNMYLWLVAHLDGLGDPTAMDLVDNVMSDLTEYNTVVHHSGIIAVEIIPLVEYHNRGHDTLTELNESTTDLPLAPTSDDAFGPENYPPTPNPEPLMHAESPAVSTPNLGPLIDSDGDVIMFDHSVPPTELNPPFLGDGSEAYPYKTELLSASPLNSPLFATPTPGLVPLLAANNSPAPPSNAPAHNTRVREVRIPRRRVVHPNVDARRTHACTFAGCSSRFTRSSDLARHWRSVHTGHLQR